jgi:hypothetical protein
MYLPTYLSTNLVEAQEQNVKINTSLGCYLSTYLPTTLATILSYY